MDAGGEYTGRKNNKNSDLAFFRREFVQNLVRPTRYSMSTFEVGNERVCARLSLSLAGHYAESYPENIRGTHQDPEIRDKKPSAITVSDIEI